MYASQKKKKKNVFKVSDKILSDAVTRGYFAK